MRSVRPLIPLLALSLSLALAGCKQDKDTDDTDADTETDTDASPIEPISIVATVDDVEVTSVPERTSNVRLTARWSGEPTTWRWSQRSGPPVSVSEHGYDSVSLDLSGFEVAAPVELVFEVSDALRRAAPVPFTLVVTPVDLERAMGPDVQVGGASSVVTTFEHAEARWMVYSAGNRLSVSPVQTSPGAEVRLHLEDYIYDVVVVERDGQRFALVALGASGLGVVDLTDPMTPTVLDTVTVDYFQDGLSFAEGGGDILVDQEISSERGPITCLETDGTTLWLGDAGYGLHRTALDNVIGPAGVVREADGTLLIDAEAFVLQYAGENPWGAPEDMKLVDGRLFVAQGFLGLGIYDPITFERVGGYNLYSDASVVEDWFIDMDVAAEVHRDPTTDEPYLDAVTGLPDYRQANFEVEQVWHGEVDAPTPWAEFDRYARYYYVARAVDVATHGPTDIAYVAYGLGGLVAVDVSGFRTATSAAPVSPTYLGSLPAAPAHGPEKPTGGGSTESLYPHYGSGKLAEAGMVDVAVDGDVVWASDHFAGLIAIEGASDPGGRWHGQNGVGAYDNDDPSLGDGILGDHWPDTEFVTSFDMAPWDPTDHESLPAWMYESPALLVSGEVIGHGGPLVVVPGSDVHAPGGVDIIQAAGSGGMMTLDIVDIAAPVNGDRFSLLGWYATTDELGAAPDGSITEPISVGHTQGVTASSQYLYVGDGPHGVTAWRIAEEDGTPIDELRLVGNTVQDEYPVTVGSVTVYPATHASNVVYLPVSEVVLSMSQTVGVRRVPVGDVEAGLGMPGAPLLLQPQLTDLFEHNADEVSVGGLHGQDHAYDATVDGDLAFVADGSNGLTVYDLSKDPTVSSSGFFAGNLGGNSQSRPPLGRATGIDLWTDTTTGTRYAFVAAGQRGVGIVDATDPAAMTYIKVFEPIKLEDDTIGKADGRCVDIRVIGDVVWVSYSSFGLVAYAIEDLIAPLPGGVDPLEIWSQDGTTPDYRPEPLDRLDLTDLPGYEGADYEFLYLDHTDAVGQVTLYVAAGHAGIAVIDGSDPAQIELLHLVPTVDAANAVAIANGRVYVADQSGGIAAFK